MNETEQVDREAWAKLLTELMAAAGKTAAETGAIVGVHPRTIGKWRKGEVEAKPEAVRDVARRLGYPAARALAEVGWLDPAEAGVGGIVAQPQLHPLAGELNKMLKEKRFPAEARNILADMLTDTLRGWLRMFRAGPGPVEPAARSTARARRGGA